MKAGVIAALCGGLAASQPPAPKNAPPGERTCLECGLVFSLAAFAGARKRCRDCALRVTLAREQERQRRRKRGPRKRPRSPTLIQAATANQSKET